MIPHDIQSFLNTSNELASLLQNELKYVQDKDYEAMQSLQNQKYKLNTLYAQKLDRLQATPNLLSSLSSDVRTLLVDTTERLNFIAQENTMILEGAHHSAQRIMKILQKVMQSTQKKFNSYGSNGVFGSHVAKTYGQSGQASALDMRM